MTKEVRLPDGTIEWHHVHDRYWTTGPWDNEPQDKVQWTDPATRLACLAVRTDMGHWCGYVGVPPGHAVHGLSSDAVDVECHGGPTFAGPCMEHGAPGQGICHVPEPGQPADVWWIGFDCAHAFDLRPRPAHWKDHLSFPHEVYRDLPYVRAQCTELARRLAGGDYVLRSPEPDDQEPG